MASPLRGPENPGRRRLRRRSLPVRRAGYGAAPPASRVLRIALRATALRAALDPGDHCGPWGQEERAGQACPRLHARRENPAVARVCKHRTPRREQMNWRSVPRTRKMNRYSRQTLARKRQASPEAEPSTISWT